MYESLKTLNATMAVAKKEMQDKGKEAIHAAFKEFFAAHPGVLAITWTQYTPYFNDGDTCEFRVGGWSIKTTTTKEDDEDDNGEEGFESEYGIEDQALRAAVSEIFKLADDDAMELTFGDHVSVVATPAGFDVEEYGHD